MIRFVTGMFVCASTTTGLGLQIVMGLIGLSLMAWGFYGMYQKGYMNDY